MSSESLGQAVANNTNWINSVISNSKLSSQLAELASIDSLDQKIVVQEGVLDAKYANAKTIRGYKGNWEADTNNPVLSNGSGVVGDIYKVSIGGNINIGSGSIDYVAGDLVYLSEDNWIKISPNQISDITGLQLALDSLADGLIPQGTWNADTNDPDIDGGIAETGYFWIVSYPGTTDVGGITDWEINDWAVKTATGWAKIDNTDKVLSVAGRTGVIVLSITDITGLTSALDNCVKLTGDQSIAGEKTFTEVVTITNRLSLSDSTNNSFIGNSTGLSNTTGATNVGLGNSALYSNTTGSTNVGIGFKSLYTNLSGFANIGLGERSLQKNTTGSANGAIGVQAMWNNTTGGNNSATGYWSLYANTTGNGNATFGNNSLVSNTTGSYNVAMGYKAGKWIADGSTPNATSENSIFIGRDTKANANSETNQIVIGDTAIGNGSNTVTLGNDSIVKTILKGSVGIGTDSPDTVLNLEGLKNTSIITLGSTNNDGGWSVGDKIGAINFYSYDGSSSAGAGLKGSISYENEQGNTGEYLSLVFRTAGINTGTNNTERMRIDSDGNTAFSGSISTTGTISGVLANGVTATTQTAGDNSTKVATTAYANAAASAIPIGDYLPLIGGTLTGALTGTSATFTGTGDSSFVGNVGIGTDSPVTKLHLYDNTATVGLSIQADNAGSSDINLGDEDDINVGRIKYDHSNNSMQFQTNNSERMRITSGGILQLKGQTPIQSFLSAKALDTDLGGTILSTIEFRKHYAINRGAAISMVQPDGVNQLYNADLAFYTNPNNAGDSLTERMRIKANGDFDFKSGDATFGGNVGIGETNPSELLHLKSGAGASTDIGLEESGIGWRLRNDQSGNAFKLSSVTGTFNTFVDRFVVKQDGNVGIGTVSPDAKLEVSSTALVSGDARYELLITEDSTASAGRGGGLAFTRQGTIFGGIKTIQNTSNNDNTTMYFQTRGAGTVANRMVIDELGNVGIGTSSPGFALDVQGDSTSGVMSVKNAANARDTFRSENAAGTRTFNIGNDANGNANVLIRNSSGATTSFIAGSGNSYFNGGNVGIGTSSPLAKLHLESDGSTSLRVERADGAATSGYLAIASEASHNTIYSRNTDGNTAKKIRIVQGSTETFSILANGNVGIGTISPDTKLHIADSTSPIFTFERLDTTTIANEVIGQFNFKSTDSSDTGVNASIKVIKQNLSVATVPMAITFETGVSGTVDERMRINSSGTIKVGPSSNSYLNIIPSNNTSSPLLQFIKTDTANQHALQFVQGQQERGSIRYSQTGTSYNTASDYRLKEDLKDFKGLEMVSNIPVYNYKWKTDESRSYGVMAHELQEVLPDAVSGEKDAEEMQGVDYSKIVPLLIKSIQELTAKVERLEAK